MNFDLTDEQTLLKSMLRQFLTQRYGFRDRVVASRCEPGYRPEIWRAFVDELGLPGVIVPEVHGGLGGGAIEQLVVMEEIGRQLVLEPVAETVFQAGWLLARGQGASLALLDRIVNEGLIASLAIGEPEMRFDFEDIATCARQTDGGWELDGRKAVVIGAPWAQALIVAARTSGQPGDGAGLTLFAMPADAQGIALVPYPTIDGRRAADVVFSGVTVSADSIIGPVDGGLDLLDELRDRALAAQAAEAAGLLDRLVSDTVDYCKQRQQFGQPLAAFQALQHRMVDMHIQVELVRAAAILAAARLDAPRHERAAAASSAKIAVAQACRFVGQNAVQLHGGMGMTDELPIGHYFKRATQIETEWGSESWHVARRNRIALESQAA
ncbi:MAG: acyl-CoA dehydrogenase family protein [Sphingomonadales bacterium]|nr:acyl-CoA dehydrogenase family protein [Sphingomonadales bacterium]